MARGVAELPSTLARGANPYAAATLVASAGVVAALPAGLAPALGPNRGCPVPPNPLVQPTNAAGPELRRAFELREA